MYAQQQTFGFFVYTTFNNHWPARVKVGCYSNNLSIDPWCRIGPYPNRPTICLSLSHSLTHSLTHSNICIYTAVPLEKSVWNKKRSVYFGVKLSRLYDPAHPFCLLAWHFPFLRTKALLHNDFGKDVEYFSFEVFPSFTFLFYWVD